MPNLKGTPRLSGLSCLWKLRLNPSMPPPESSQVHATYLLHLRLQLVMQRLQACHPLLQCCDLALQRLMLSLQCLSHISMDSNAISHSSNICAGSIQESFYEEGAIHFGGASKVLEGCQGPEQKFKPLMA
eukprot:1137331-Pelagomonas_calceolata.AAC.3